MSYIYCAWGDKRPSAVSWELSFRRCGEACADARANGSICYLLGRAYRGICETLAPTLTSPIRGEVSVPVTNHQQRGIAQEMYPDIFTLDMVVACPVDRPSPATLTPHQASTAPPSLRTLNLQAGPTRQVSHPYASPW